MNIAIDLDKTLFYCDSTIYKFIGNILPSENKLASLHYTVIDKDEKKLNIFKNVLKMFNAKYYQEFENAVKTIRTWYEAGHNITFLSSRPDWQSSKETVLSWLENFDVPYNMLVMACNNKAQFCKTHKQDILIDDQLQTCRNAKQLSIDSIYFNQDLNSKEKQLAVLYDIVTASSWGEIETKVDNLIKSKSINKFQSEPAL